MPQNNLANFIPEKWSKQLAVVLRNSGVMKQLVDSSYESEIKDSGDTVNIRKAAAITVNDYAGAINYEGLSPSLIQLLIDQAKYFAFKVDDINKAQSDIKIMDTYLEQAKISLDLAQDTYLLSLHSSAPSANIVSSGNDGTTGYTLSKDTVYGLAVEARRRLARSNAYKLAAAGEKPSWVVPPEVMEVIVKAPEFIGRSTAQGDQVIKDGVYKGDLGGLNVYEATNLVSVSSNYYTPVIFKKAITFAEQVTKIETIRLQGEFSDAIRGLNVYGAKAVNEYGIGKIIFAA